MCKGNHFVRDCPSLLSAQLHVRHETRREADSSNPPHLVPRQPTNPIPSLNATKLQRFQRQCVPRSLLYRSSIQPCLRCVKSPLPELLGCIYSSFWVHCRLYPYGSWQIPALYAISLTKPCIDDSLTSPRYAIQEMNESSVATAKPSIIKDLPFCQCPSVRISVGTNSASCPISLSRY